MSTAVLCPTVVSAMVDRHVVSPSLLKLVNERKSETKSLLSGVLRYMRNVHGDTPNFLSRKDWRFRELRGTME